MEIKSIYLATRNSLLLLLIMTCGVISHVGAVSGEVIVNAKKTSLRISWSLN